MYEACLAWRELTFSSHLFVQMVALEITMRQTLFHFATIVCYDAIVADQCDDILTLVDMNDVFCNPR